MFHHYFVISFYPIIVGHDSMKPTKNFIGTFLIVSPSEWDTLESKVYETMGINVFRSALWNFELDQTTSKDMVGAVQGFLQVLKFSFNLNLTKWLEQI